METLENLLKEYKIRFNVTDKIKPEGYPFDTFPNFASSELLITPTRVTNINGHVYKYGIWAVADVKEVPEKWVVKKDENNPLWENFTEWFYDPASPNFPYSEFDYFGNNKEHSGNLIHRFQGYQYLTLKQWYDLIYLSKLNEPKIGDWGICYDNYELEKKQLKSVITINKLKEVCLLESYPYSILNTIRKYFFKIDLERPLQPQINEFLKLK